MPSERTSATGRSLIDAATRTNQAAPDATVSTRPIHAKTGERRPNGGGQARLVAGFRKSRFGDEDDEEDDTRHHDRRGEMDSANVDQRVIQSVLPARAFPKGVPIGRRHGR